MMWRDWGYDAEKNQLLLACKGSPNITIQKEKSKGKKNVFGWSIANQKLIEAPILTIMDDDMLEFLKTNFDGLSKSKMKKYKKRVKSFSPSGIAFNPTDGMYYLISSVGKLLFVLDQNSIIQHIEFLDNTYFAQPEGICFGPQNELYISNEGRGLIAKLLKFDSKR